MAQVGKSNHIGSKFAIGTILGVVAGAIAGVLFAPKSGKETREDIKDETKKLAHSAEAELKKLEGEIASKLKSSKLAATVKKEAEQIIKEIREALGDEDITPEKLEKTLKRAKSVKSRVVGTKKVAKKSTAKK
jgi:gas vesicle protein